MSNLSQIAQVVVNLEHFCTACEELEGVLMHLRYVRPTDAGTALTSIVHRSEADLSS